MTVRFSYVGDFLDELTKDVAHIDRKIVRCQTELVSRGDWPFEKASVVATVRVKGEVVQLEEFAGERWKSAADDPMNTETLKRAESIGERVRQFCEHHDLELRGGRYE